MAVPVYLLIGCTASGKSRVGFELAKRLGGEIVSIDSMKVYRRMDVGTAKLSPAALAEVRHHLIDVVEPSQPFSLGRYSELADAAIRDAASRGKPVLAVGGTMLYVQGLVHGVFEGPSADEDFRREFRERVKRDSLDALYAELERVDPESASRIHRNDARRIERALEVFHLTGQPISAMQTQWGSGASPYECRIVALQRPKEEANQRINSRVVRMFKVGLVDEVRRLLAGAGGIGPQAAQAVGYAETIAHLRRTMSLEEAIERTKISSRRLAKHQRTWMRRMPNVTWVDVTERDSVPQITDRVAAAWGVG